MKRCFLLALCVCALIAQSPIPDSTVIGTVAGKNITAGDVRAMIRSDPRFLPSFKGNPTVTIRDYYIARALAAKADELKLGEQSPVKEQLELARMSVLGSAMLTHELNAYMVSEEEAQAYYKANQSQFEQASISYIKINFRPDVKAAGTSDEALKQQAEAVVGAAHSTRTESEAKKFADDLVKQVRNAANFAELAKKYSDDEMTKSAGGAFGVVSPNGFLPPEMKRLAAELKRGDVSDPVKIGSIAFYIIRCDSKVAAPFNEVHNDVLVAVRQQHVKQMMADLEKRYTPAIEKPDVLVQVGNGK